MQQMAHLCPEQTTAPDIQEAHTKVPIVGCVHICDQAPNIANCREEFEVGILKTAAKVVGTATLSATWLASGILRKVSDAAGVDIGSELFGMGQDASANGIKSMWQGNSADVTEADETAADVDALEKRKRQLRSAASQCFEMARAAERAGNQEKHDQLMARYETLIEEVSAYDDEILKVKSGQI